jgi:stage IV sporulation protein FB
MKIKIDLTILIFLVVFYFTKQLDLYILILLFAFLHECSHILFGKILGFKLRRIELMPFGFFCKLKPNIDDYNKKVLNSNMVELKKIFVAISGPLSNIAIIFFTLIIHRIYGIEKYNIIVYSNFLIFLFNFIPIYPLDGGRVVKSFWKILYGNSKAYQLIDSFSRYMIIMFTVICSFLILYLKNILIIFVLAYLWHLVIEEHKNYVMKKMLDEVLEM